METHGPNVTKLITKCIAREAIPPGGGIADGIEFFRNPDYRKEVLIKAEARAMDYISQIKAAPDNPYGNDEEAIAQAIVDRLEDARRKRQINPYSTTEG